MTTKKKEEYHATIEVTSEVDLRKSVQHSPLQYLSSWDFFVVFLAVLLRFLVEVSKKSNEIEKEKKQRV